MIKRIQIIIFLLFIISMPDQCKAGEINAQETAQNPAVGTEQSDFKTEPILIIACSKEYPPFSFLNAEGKPAGLLIDIWRLWSEKSSRHIQFHLSSWEDTLNNLKSGRADIHSGLFRTPDLNTWIDFSQPLYQTNSNLFYTAEKNDITGLNDLADQKVGVIYGGYAADFLHENWKDVRVIEFEAIEELIIAASERKIRAFMDETPSILSLLIQLGKSGEFKYLKEPLYSRKIFAGVRKGEKELLNKIETGIEAISHEEFTEIEKRWIPDQDARYFGSVVRDIKLTPSEEAWIKEHTPLRVGVGTSWAPFQYVENGEFKGMAADYIRILNERLGLSMEVVKGISWSEVLEKGKKREIDVFACVTETPERRTFMSFTHAYLSSPTVIITQKDAPFVGRLQDLYGKKVAIVKNLATYPQIKKNHPAIIPYFVNTPPETLEAVSMGRADASIENLMVASYMIQKKGLANLKVAAPSELENTDLCFGVRNDWTPLVNILNKGIDSITNEEHNAIRQKWVAVRYEYGIDTEYLWKVGLQIGGVVIFILAMVFFWNIQIRRREERFRGLTEHGTDITLAFKKEGTIVYQSPSHKALLGYDQNELIGKSAYDLFHEADKSRWEKVMDSLLHKETVLSFIHRLRHKDGDFPYFESNCINLLDNKALKAIVINARDITERKAAEEALQESNKKIMDSIQYAKKIQSSLLPDMDMIKLHLPENFFIWMPRDIVGGDIFFAEYISSEKKRGMVIAVIDCTGHGVPGAFMTMIASSGLRRIIKDEGCHDPAEILKRLNFFVKTTLQQDTEHARSDDGLDAAVCFIEEDRLSSSDSSPLNHPCHLIFSGSRLPLYYVQNDDLHFIKGDRQSIGYKRSDLNFNFTSHLIQIKDETAFYIATDGFTDQLGGEEKRIPFGKKRLKVLLNNIWREPFEKQHEILLEHLKEYQGDHERQDDVTLFGFRLKCQSGM